MNRTLARTSIFAALLAGGTLLLAFAVARTGTATAGDAPVSLDAIADSSRYQQGVLQDGMVTEAEYVEAVTKEVACLRGAADVELKGPYWDPTGRFYTYVYKVTGTTADNEQAIEAEAVCSERYRSLVETVWAEQTLPTKEERAQIGRNLSTCLAKAGAAIEVGSEPTIDDVEMIEEGGLTEQQRACLEKGADYFAVARPDGERP